MMGSIESHSISESIQFSAMEGVQSSSLEHTTTIHTRAYSRRSIHTAILMMENTPFRSINTSILLRHSLRSFVSHFPGTSPTNSPLFYCVLFSPCLARDNWVKLNLAAPSSLLLSRYCRPYYYHTLDISNLIYHPTSFFYLISRQILREYSRNELFNLVLSHGSTAARCNSQQIFIAASA